MTALLRSVFSGTDEERERVQRAERKASKSGKLRSAADTRRQNANAAGQLITFRSSIPIPQAEKHSGHAELDPSPLLFVF
eukprot:3322356-Pyramimonas_sp.AAC.1